MTGQLPANSDDGSDQRFHLLAICMPRYANIADLEQALRTMHDAHRRNDLAYLDEAMADDFTIIHANGDLLTKEEWFADLRSGAPAGSVSTSTREPRLR